MKSISLFSTLIFYLFLSSCTEDNLPLECPTDIACTEQFVFFTYTPVDDQNQSILLDSYYSQNLDNAQTYTFTHEDTGLTANNYIVITDAQIEELKATGTAIRFIGIKNERVVLEQDFVIGHNCCHIVPLQGPGID